MVNDMQAGGMRLSTDHTALYDTRILYSLLNNYANRFTSAKMNACQARISK